MTFDEHISKEMNRWLWLVDWLVGGWLAGWLVGWVDGSMEGWAGG